MNYYNLSNTFTSFITRPYSEELDKKESLDIQTKQQETSQETSSDDFDDFDDFGSSTNDASKVSLSGLLKNIQGHQSQETTQSLEESLKILTQGNSNENDIKNVAKSFIDNIYNNKARTIILNAVDNNDKDKKRIKEILIKQDEDKTIQINVEDKDNRIVTLKPTENPRYFVNGQFNRNALKNNEILIVDAGSYAIIERNVNILRRIEIGTNQSSSSQESSQETSNDTSNETSQSNAKTNDITDIINGILIEKTQKPSLTITKKPQ